MSLAQTRLEKDFQKFHSKNPAVWLEFKRYTFESIESGKQHYSAHSFFFWAVIRFSWALVRIRANTSSTETKQGMFAKWRASKKCQTKVLAMRRCEKVQQRFGTNSSLREVSLCRTKVLAAYAPARDRHIGCWLVLSVKS